MKKIVYLDNAATSGKKPDNVKKAVMKTMENYCANPGRSGHFLSVSAQKAVYEVREKTAGMFGISKAENVIFTQNTTHALNIAVNTAGQRKKTVISSVMEHNSVLRPLYALEEKYGVKTVFLTPDFNNTDKFGEEVIRKIDRDCGAVVLTACSNVTGSLLPLKKIGRVCREKGIIFIVDGAQAAGHYGINMTENCIDMLCIPSHKGLLGICGGGALIVGDNFTEKINPVLMGGSGIYSVKKQMPDSLPERLEAGTLPFAPILSMGAGIDFLKKAGIEELNFRSTRAAQRLRELLGNTKGVTLYSCHGNIVLFNIEGKESFKTAEMLDRCGISVRSGLHCAPLCHKALGTGKDGGVRASFGWFNTPSDSEYLWKCIRNYL